MKHITLKNLLLGFLVFLTIGIFNSCSKFEDGPGLSLKSKKARLTNTWEIEKVYDSNGAEINFIQVLLGDSLVEMMNTYGVEITSMKFEFIKDNTMKILISAKMITFPIPDIENVGTWEFSGKTGLKTILNGDISKGIPSSSSEYNILRLSSSELWLENSDLGETYEIHLISSEE